MNWPDYCYLRENLTTYSLESSAQSARAVPRAGSTVVADDPDIVFDNRLEWCRILLSHEVYLFAFNSALSLEHQGSKSKVSSSSRQRHLCSFTSFSLSSTSRASCLCKLFKPVRQLDKGDLSWSVARTRSRSQSLLLRQLTSENTLVTKHKPLKT